MSDKMGVKLLEDARLRAQKILDSEAIDYGRDGPEEPLALLLIVAWLAHRQPRPAKAYLVQVFEDLLKSNIAVSLH